MQQVDGARIQRSWRHNGFKGLPKLDAAVRGAVHWGKDEYMEQLPQRSPRTLAA